MVLLDQLLDEVGDEENHELFLMDQHGHTQKDIAYIFGSRGNTSKVLSGKREMNLNHIKKLCAHYHVSGDLFINL